MRDLKKIYATGTISQEVVKEALDYFSKAMNDAGVANTFKSHFRLTLLVRTGGVFSFGQCEKEKPEGGFGFTDLQIYLRFLRFFTVWVLKTVNGFSYLKTAFFCIIYRFTVFFNSKR